MAKFNNLWDLFTSEHDSITKELLGTQQKLAFSPKPIDQSTFRTELVPTDEYLKIVVNVSEKGKSGKLLYFYNTATATQIEFYMLQGFSELLHSIEATTIDANKEFLQTILNKITTSMIREELGEIKFDIDSIEVVFDTSSISGLHEFPNIFKIQWQKDDHSSLLFCIGLSSFTFMRLNPDKESQHDLKNAPDYSHTKTPNTKNDDIIVIEIEDCDKRKKLYKEEVDNIRLVLGVELKLSVRIGIKKMLLKDVVNIDIGTTIELDKMVNEPLDILINEVKIAEGEIVVVEGKFGIQISKITSKFERLSKIKFKN